MIKDHLDLAAARAERKRLQRAYSGLFEDLSALLYRIDPMGINFEVNPDEYDAEVGTILPRVLQLETASEIQQVIREEFVRWFGTCPIEAATYQELATETLEVLSRYRLR